MPPRRRSGSRRSRRLPQTPPDRHPINRRITAPEVRLISETKENLGIVPTEEALRRAQEAGLDLVMVSETARPPVCRIMDYGKYRYEVQKREAKARKNASQVTTKELRLRYRTDSGDLETKLKHAREFLENGDKVKFTMRFRGREIVYAQAGAAKLDAIVQALSDIATVDERSAPRGRVLYVVLAPNKSNA